jgi:hypothetical protein
MTGESGTAAILERLTPESLPHLARFLAGSLHEDWESEFGSAAEAAYDYLLYSDWDDAAALATEWAELTAASSVLPIGELNRILSERFHSGWSAADANEIKAVMQELERALEE